MTGTLMLSSLVRADVAKELVFTARVFDGREAFALGLATKLSDTPHDDAMAMARRDRRPQPRRDPWCQGVAERLVQPGRGQQFAEERRVIGSLIGRPNQVEAVMANFEKRPPAFTDPA